MTSLANESAISCADKSIDKLAMTVMQIEDRKQSCALEL